MLTEGGVLPSAIARHTCMPPGFQSLPTTLRFDDHSMHVVALAFLTCITDRDASGVADGSAAGCGRSFPDVQFKPLWFAIVKLA